MSNITDRYLNEAGIPKMFRKRGDSISIAKDVVDAINKLVIQLEDDGDSRSREVERRRRFQKLHIMDKKR